MQIRYFHECNSLASSMTPEMCLHQPTLTHLFKSLGTIRIPVPLSSVSSAGRRYASTTKMTTAAGKSLDNPNGVHKQYNAWQQPGPASYDFRSDTHTTPTASMLDAITHTTLLDDVFLEDPTTNDLEALCASLTGHEAGLLVMSGTMGNQVSLRTHLTSPPHSVLTDHRSHIIKYEAGGVSLISGAMVMPVVPSNGHHLTLEDVKEHIVLSTDIHACPTRVISLENTLNGMIMPLAEVQKISAFAREHNVLMHCDGARLWEAAAADAGTLSEYSHCFDSVTMCFSKGLGAPIGSVIVGSKSFISRARHFRKMLGGGTRQAGIISAAARVAVLETFGSGPRGEGGKLRDSHKRAREIADIWEKKGGKLANPVETNMVWLDLEAAGVSMTDWIAMTKNEGITSRGGRLVIHYQITEESCKKLENVMDKIFSKTNGA